MSVSTHLKILVIDTFSQFKTINELINKIVPSLQEGSGSHYPKKVLIPTSIETHHAANALVGVREIKQAYKKKAPYNMVYLQLDSPLPAKIINVISSLLEVDPAIHIILGGAHPIQSLEELLPIFALNDNVILLQTPMTLHSVCDLLVLLINKDKLCNELKRYTELMKKTLQEKSDILMKSLFPQPHYYHDFLTSLPNRTLMMQTIEDEIKQLRGKKKKFAVLFIDLDRFKAINENLNHHIGDILLCMLTNRLSNATNSPIVGRWSGDEFIVLLKKDFTTLAKGLKTVQEILDRIAKPFHIQERNLSITASIGISIFPEDGQSAEVLLRHAELAMYCAKNRGGNQFELFTLDIKQLSLIQFEKEHDLHRALSKQELYLQYQPQVDVHSNAPVAVEALVRWNHPYYGNLLPMDFIPLAEDTGLIVPIGEWVLRQACLQNKLWQEQGLEPIVISVNVATKQFMQPNFIKTVKSILQETKLEPEYLEIEITENVLVSHISVIKGIQDLKKLGLKIALDDFGTGNSGLHFLRSMPIDRLKIDQSFVQNVTNESDQVIINAILAIARSLSLDVVAEGVETEQQLLFLKEKECSKYQGYLFGKPMDADELALFFERYKKVC